MSYGKAAEFLKINTTTLRENALKNKTIKHKGEKYKLYIKIETLDST